MPAPAIPPASMSQGQLIALLTAQQGAVLKAVKAALPTSPDGLNPGDPWADGDTIAFVSKPQT